MKMRKLYTYSLIGAMALGIGVSCSDSFLDQQPPGSYPENAIDTKSGVEGLLINAYATLHGPAGNWYVTPINWVWGSVVSDEAYKGSESSDQSDINPIQRFDTQPSNPLVKNKWDAVYDGIGRSNLVLQKLKVPEIAALFSADEITNITAQVRFLRGLHHFEGAKVFNKIVYIDENVTDYIIPNTTPVWDKIAADFQYAYENLPATQDGVGRANKWAAASYLAKVYMFQGESKFPQAKTVIEDIMTNGTTATGVKYGLVDKYADNFHVTTESNKEAIFALQFSVNDGSNTNGNYENALNYPHNTGAPGAGCCGFYQPSQSLVNSFKTVGGLPDFDSYNDAVLLSDEAIISTGIWDAAVSYKLKDSVYISRPDPAKPYVDRVYKALTDNSGKDPLTNPSDWKLKWVENDTQTFDPRLDWTVGRRGIPYLDWGSHPGRNWIRKVDFGGPYSPKKNVFYKADKDAGLAGVAGWGWNNSAQNFTLIRYSDVLLWYAEILVSEGALDDASGAAYYVNLVRARAANPDGFVKNPDGTDAANYDIAEYPSFPDEAYAMRAIQFERKLELAMEGHRLFDLVRWGVAEDIMTDYLAVENVRRQSLFSGAVFKPKNRYQPIPEYAINQSFQNGEATLDQNDGY